jgi:amino acid adenylation domain
MKDNTIYSKFKSVAERQPDATAIIEDGRSFTYKDLDNLVDAIMSRFIGERHSFIGITMTHSAEMVAAMLAVLKSGAAYIPAELFLPQDRIDYMMRSAGVGLVITDEYCRNLNPTTRGYIDNSAPDGIAYCLFTSGTTGRPKGVLVENESVVRYAEAFNNEFQVKPTDIMLQYSVASFDIFVEEVFASLLNGAALAIPSNRVREAGIAELMNFVNRHGVTEISGFPYLIADIDKYGKIPSSVRLLISGGDVLRENYIHNLREKHILIYNTYGPSETTVCATYYRCDNTQPLEDGTFPIGTAVKGAEVRVLDNDMKPAGQGEVGEICILGSGVGRGYLGNVPEQENFVISSDGKRMYRSGDLGYIQDDGNIVFLRRKDEQVMIKGQRVEPKEVENVLNTCTDIEKGVVVARRHNGNTSLIAYFVPKHSEKYSVESITDCLKSKLVDFMIPEYLVAMHTLPLTQNGKVDIAGLPYIYKSDRQ